MPGNFIFRPKEANLTHDTNLITRMDPYCVFLVGTDKIETDVCKHGGKNPTWNEDIIVPAPEQSMMMVKVMDRDKITSDDHIGSFSLDLKEIESQGFVSKWYPLFYKNKAAGEILVESEFKPGLPTEGPTVIEEETVIREGGMQEEGATQTFVEQKQTVVPHKFTKEIEVVEMQPTVKKVKVTEPQKVLKEVQYTEVVPVTKAVETIEPKVVRKEVEVIEPRLVTKTIEVVENVPVIKEVEVIESVPVVKEVETFEPQTFTKTVEVTEQVPVVKEVTVTEPVTVRKNVELVEPIITTETITKEVRQPVVVDDKITTTVGPATVIGVQEGGVVIEKSSLEKERTLLERERLLLEEKERALLKEKERIIESEKTTTAPVITTEKTVTQEVCEPVVVQETVKTDAIDGENTEIIEAEVIQETKTVQGSNTKGKKGQKVIESEVVVTETIIENVSPSPHGYNTRHKKH